MEDIYFGRHRQTLHKRLVITGSTKLKSKNSFCPLPAIILISITSLTHFNTKIIKAIIPIHHLEAYSKIILWCQGTQLA